MELRKELQERLEILQSAGMIEDEVVVFCERTIDLIWEEIEQPSAEKMEIFVTHLAMAAQRILQRQEEEMVDAFIEEQLQSDPMYEKAKAILHKIEQLSNLEFPDSERHLLLIHVCNICKEQ